MQKMMFGANNDKPHDIEHVMGFVFLYRVELAISSAAACPTYAGH